MEQARVLDNLFRTDEWQATTMPTNTPPDKACRYVRVELYEPALEQENVAMHAAVLMFWLYMHVLSAACGDQNVRGVFPHLGA